MKTRLAFLTLSVALLVGCGGGNGSDSNNNGGGGGGGGGTAGPLAYLYVASANPNGNVATYSMSSSGALTSSGTVSVGPDPRFIALGRTGSLLLVPTITDGALAVLNSSASGSLTSNSRVGGISQPIEVEVHPNGNFPYVLKLGGGIDVYTLNASGAPVFASTISIPAGSPTRLALDPTGGFLYLGIAGGNSATSGIQTYSVNGSTGALTAAGFLPTTGLPGNLLVVGSRLFAVFPDALNDQAPSQVQVFPIQAGGLPGALIGSATAVGGSSSLALTPNGNFLYVGNNGTNNISGFQVGSAGSLTALGGFPVAAGTHVSDLVIEPSGAFLIACNTFGNSVQVFGISANGSLSLANSTTINEPISLAVVHK